MIAYAQLDVGTENQESESIQKKSDLKKSNPIQKKDPLTSGKRITVNIKDMTLNNVLRAISAQTDINFVTKGDLGEIKFTTYLKDVTVLNALEALLEAQGLVYEQVAQSNIVIVKQRKDSRPRMLTQVFKLKYVQLAVDDSSSDATDRQSGFDFIDTGGGGGGESKSEDESKASGMVSIIRSMLSPYGSLQVDMHTNSMVITDVPSTFPRLRNTIAELDVLPPQILIDVKVVETEISDTSNKGIDWGGAEGALAQVIGPTRVTHFPIRGFEGDFFPSDADLEGGTVAQQGDFGLQGNKGVSYGILNLQNLRAILKMVQTKGVGKFLARPSILTLNNKRAEIRILSDTAVGIQSASIIKQNGLLVETAERKPTGIFLSVTPQVNIDNMVMLLIDASVSQPRNSEFFPDKFVDAQTRAVRTAITVKDGHAVFIGGLISEDETEVEKEIPVIGALPLLGPMFSVKKKVKKSKELTIFIIPKVLKTHES